MAAKFILRLGVWDPAVGAMDYATWFEPVIVAFNDSECDSFFEFLQQYNAHGSYDEDDITFDSADDLAFFLLKFA